MANDKQVNITMDADMAREIDEWGKQHGFEKVNDFRMLIMVLGHSITKFDYKTIVSLIKKINPAADIDNPQLNMFDKMKATRTFEVATALKDISDMSFETVQGSVSDPVLERAILRIMHNNDELKDSKVGFIKLENTMEVHAVLYPDKSQDLDGEREIAGIFKES